MRSNRRLIGGSIRSDRARRRRRHRRRPLQGHQWPLAEHPHQAHGHGRRRLRRPHRQIRTHDCELARHVATGQPPIHTDPRGSNGLREGQFRIVLDKPVEGTYPAFEPRGATDALAPSPWRGVARPSRDQRLQRACKAGAAMALWSIPRYPNRMRLLTCGRLYAAMPAAGASLPRTKGTRAHWLAEPAGAPRRDVPLSPSSAESPR